MDKRNSNPAEAGTAQGSISDGGCRARSLHRRAGEGNRRVRVEITAKLGQRRGAEALFKR